jgi:hypothetical protein
MRACYGQNLGICFASILAPARGMGARRVKEKETRVEPPFRHRTVKMAPFRLAPSEKDVIVIRREVEGW